MPNPAKVFVQSNAPDKEKVPLSLEHPSLPPATH